MNAIKGLILSVVCVIVFYGSAIFIGSWAGFAHVSYVNTMNLLAKGNK